MSENNDNQNNLENAGDISSSSPSTCWVLEESYSGDPFFLKAIYLDENMAYAEMSKLEKESKYCVYMVSEEPLISPNVIDELPHPTRKE